MVIQCPKCKKQYNVDSERITESGVKITCPGCRHQFIARRKADENEKANRKSQAKAPKTPPCAICGAPSTHVLRGPPPRPVCEHHYEVEKEKETRFWDTDDGFVPPGIKDQAKTQPGPTTSAPKRVVPPPDAEPAFESFDDFDFFDDTGAAPKSQKQASEEATFDFDDEAFGRPEGRTPAQPATPAESPRQEFGSRDIDFAPSASPPPAKHGQAPAGTSPDPFTEFGFNSSSADADQNVSEEFKRESSNLDGSPADDRYADFDEMEASFAWKPGESSTATGNGATALDQEMGSELELAQPSTLPPPPPSATAKKTESDPRLLKSAKPRSARSAAVLLAVFAVMLAGSAFVSLTKAADRLVRDVKFIEPSPKPWQGSLEWEVAPQRTGPSGVMTANLEPETKAGPASEEIAAHAWRTLLPDTAAALDQALETVDKGLADYPDSPELHSLKISILAFRESIDAKGNTSLAGKDAAAAYNKVSRELRERPAMVRAHAHVLLNTGNPDGALDEVEKSLSSNPNDPLGLFIKGQALRFQPKGDAAEAAEVLDRAITAQPDFARARWELARLLEAEKRPRDAAPQYREISAVSPDRPGVAEARERLAQLAPAPDPDEPDTVPGTTTADTSPSKPEFKPNAITATGNEISNNIKDSMTTVDQYMRRHRKTGDTTPNIPRPPEEGPPGQPRPPEEGP